MKDQSLQQMDERQLLIHLARKSEAAEKHRRIAAWAIVVLAAAVVLALIMVIPRLLNVLQDAQEAVNNANGLIQQIQPAADEFSKIDFEGLGDSITKLESAIDNFSSFTGIFH